jgi:hypothetical protein
MSDFTELNEEELEDFIAEALEAGLTEEEIEEALDNLLYEDEEQLDELSSEKVSDYLMKSSGRKGAKTALKKLQGTANVPATDKRAVNEALNNLIEGNASAMKDNIESVISEKVLVMLEERKKQIAATVFPRED